MAGYVGEIALGETLSAKPYFTGAWREFSREQVPPGATREFDAADAEYAVIVVSGSGTAKVGSRSQTFDAGSSFTVGYRSLLVLTTGPGPVELFVTTLDVSS